MNFIYFNLTVTGNLLKFLFKKIFQSFFVVQNVVKVFQPILIQSWRIHWIRFLLEGRKWQVRLIGSSMTNLLPLIVCSSPHLQQELMFFYQQCSHFVLITAVASQLQPKITFIVSLVPLICRLNPEISQKLLGEKNKHFSLYGKKQCYSRATFLLWYHIFIVVGWNNQRLLMSFLIRILVDHGTIFILPTGAGGIL